MSDAIGDLHALGQSIWFDNLSRGLIDSEALRRMVGEGLAGVTSNPTIFEQAIDGTNDYDGAIAELIGRGVRDPQAIYESLAIDDIRRAAEVLRPVHRRTGGRDGFVSLEVSPRLAHDTAATIAEARRLFSAVARENVMIKVPGTKEGVPAVEELTATGMNVNITLLFGIDAYLAVAEAYLRGLERRARAGGDPGEVASVASFFLSRIDTLVDQRLVEAARRDPARAARLEALSGKVAVANAKVAYREYQRLIKDKLLATLHRKLDEGRAAGQPGA